YFFVSGTVSPLAYLLFNRSSLKVLFGLSAVLNVVSYVLLSPPSTSLALAFTSMAISGGAGGLYYPVSDVLESMYVSESAHRARQLSFGIAMSTLGAAIGAGAGGLAITHAGFAGVAGLTAFAYVG